MTAKADVSIDGLEDLLNALTGLLGGLNVADGAAFLESLNLPGLLGSLSGLLDTVTTGLGALPGFLEGIEGSLGSFLDVVGPALNGLLATVEPLVISLGNILSSADGLLAGLVALNQSVGPIIAGITDFFTAGVQNLLVPFIPLLEAVGPALDRIIGDFLSSVRSLSSALDTVIVPVASALGDFLINGILSFEDFSEGLAVLLRALDFRITGALGSFSSGAGDIFRSIADWLGLPPEVNSASINSGAGPTTMLAAASASQALSVSTAESSAEVQTAMSELATAGLQGVAGDAVARSLGPQAEWMTEVANGLQGAGQAQAQVAAAYQAARATTPSVGEIQTNQNSFVNLENTNFMGINSGSLASNRADYGRMWVQAGSAMNGYAAQAEAAAAQAVASTPSPPPAGPPAAAGAVGAGGLASQGSGVVTAAGSMVATGAGLVGGVAPAAAMGTAGSAGAAPVVGGASGVAGPSAALLSTAQQPGASGTPGGLLRAGEGQNSKGDFRLPQSWVPPADDMGLTPLASPGMTVSVSENVDGGSLLAELGRERVSL